MKVALRLSYSSLFKLGLKIIRVRVIKFYFKVSKKKFIYNFFFLGQVRGFILTPVYNVTFDVETGFMFFVLYLSIAAKVAMSCAVFSRVTTVLSAGFVFYLVE